MSKLALVTLCAAVFAAGCANLQGGVSLPIPRDTGEITSVQAFDLLPFVRPARCGVNVYVDEDNNISIDHEPVRTKRCVGIARKIVWKLDPADTTAFFPVNAIVLKSSPAAGDPACGPVSGSGGNKFECTFSGPPNSQTYFYKITVLKEGMPQMLDPSMVND